MAKKAAAKVEVVREGQVWAVPVPGMGYCPAVVARAPKPDADVDFVLLYLRAEVSAKPPKSVPPLSEWGKAWIGLIPTQPFRKGRWTLCGEVKGFDRDEWPMPPSRASAVDERVPPEEWGKDAWGEMWSIETSLDEPTMTVIENAPATREQALGFPQVSVVIAASGLEKGLTHLLKKRRAGFWDVEVKLDDVSAAAVRRWNKHASAARKNWKGIPPGWLPAGKKTDRDTHAGQWFGFPMQGGGFGAAILIEKPAMHHRVFSDAVVMSMKRRWDRWPTMDDLRGLKPEEGMLVAQTSLIVVRDGRWRVVGEHPAFDPAEWVWPRPWSQNVEQRKANSISVAINQSKSVDLKLHPKILALDPHAGERCSGSQSGYGIELDTARGIAGTAPAINDDLPHSFRGFVTSERLKAWRTINAAIEAELAKRK